MHNKYITDLLGIQGVICKKVIYDELNNENHIFLVSNSNKPLKCPKCNSNKINVHDYSTSIIKHVPIGNIPTKLHIKKCRYKCSYCKATVMNSINFVGKNMRTSKALNYEILTDLKSTQSFSDIAKKNHISVAHVKRMLQCTTGGNTVLPRALCIDEFKGNTDKEKYHVLLLDFETGKVINVIKHRNITYLKQYMRKNFKDFNKVEFFISDMYKPYIELAKSLFKKATIIVDKFHYTRYVI